VVSAIAQKTREEAMTDVARPGDSDLARLWNGPAGRAWVDAEALIGQLFKPVEDLLVAAVAGEGSMPGHVLDVGCGTGGTTLALARRLGAAGRATGIDISAPMIAAARARAGREGVAAEFICANAQDHVFAPAVFDRIFSRFGVMFFEDFVRAFANLRHAAKEGARFTFIAWRSAVENAFMTTAERAAAPLLPSLPARRDNAAGQFAFADRQRVAAILAESGWTGIEIRPVDIPCTFPATALVGYFTRLGPVGVALLDVNEQKRTEIIATVRAAFDPFVADGAVRFTAACWRVDARAGAAPRQGS
jgi:SAM-dependent methyltransferase